MYRDTGGIFRGFLLDERGFTTIDVPAALTSVAHKINDHGQVVGGYSTRSTRASPRATAMSGTTAS
jgi:uncharacterized membrane protein